MNTETPHPPPAIPRPVSSPTLGKIPPEPTPPPPRLIQESEDKPTERLAAPTGFSDGEMRDRLIIAGFAAGMRKSLAISRLDSAAIVASVDRVMEARKVIIK